jgi:hypothetical protein
MTRAFQIDCGAYYEAFTGQDEIYLEEEEEELRAIFNLQ